MLDTEKLVRKAREEGREEGREEVQIEMASGVIKKFMSLGMSFEKALSEVLECTQLSNSSVQSLKERFS